MKDQDKSSTASIPVPPQGQHVDEFVSDMGHEDKPDMGDAMYARWFLMHARLPAYMAMNFSRFMKDKKLFCTFRGERWRCTGGSRLGDVWLTKDFDREVGYEMRVYPNNCCQWSDKP